MEYSEFLEKYVSNLVVSSNSVQNFETLVNLCDNLSNRLKKTAYDECMNLLENNSVVFNIVRSVVLDNMDVITNNKISSICSSPYFISFIDAYCTLNDIEIEREEVNVDLSSVSTNDYYYKMIRTIPVLSFDEEKSLFNLLKSSDENIRKNARKKIANSNLRLVVSVASKYSKYRLPFDDLVSEGNIGLLYAIDKFDVSRGNKFSTYATWWIRQRILRAINEQSNNIKLSHIFLSKIKVYYEYIDEFQSLYGRIPTLDEVISDTGLTVGDIKLIKQDLGDTVSLDSPIGDDDDSLLGDFIADDDMSIDKIIDNENLREAFFKVFEELKSADRRILDKHIDIIIMRYGLDGKGKRTLEEIGKKHNITRERVRQLETKVFSKIRRSKKCIAILRDYISSYSYTKNVLNSNSNNYLDEMNKALIKYKKNNN